MKKYLVIIILFLCPNFMIAQCNNWSPFQLVKDTFPNPIFGNYLTPECDKLSRPYVYVAAKDGGIKVYDISLPGNMILATTISTSLFGNVDAINIIQDSVYLYVTLGDIWNTNEEAGLAIVDVSNPLSPVVLDYYLHPLAPGGAAAVAIKNNYAYVAAMGNGLIIFDIGNKTNITFKSMLSLANNFPHTNTLGDTISKYNARGIALKDSLAYICYDRGGLRIVNVSDVNNPVQTNQYCFDSLINKATAYNNIVIHNNLAFVTIDYYGLEILDITNPQNINQLSWWHPSGWAPATNDYLVWANSDGHANEIIFDSLCYRVYITAGRSDVVSISVVDSLNPATCETYGSVTDTYGTWGLDYYDNNVYAAYIWSPFFPPYSNYTGLRQIQTTVCNSSATIEIQQQNSLSIFPNPNNGEFYISPSKIFENGNLTVIDWQGKKVFETKIIGNLFENVSVSLSPGIYFVMIRNCENVYTEKVIVY